MRKNLIRAVPFVLAALLVSCETPTTSPNATAATDAHAAAAGTATNNGTTSSESNGQTASTKTTTQTSHAAKASWKPYGARQTGSNF